MKGEVVFGGEDVIGTLVGVDIDGLVTSHLSGHHNGIGVGLARHVSLEEESLLDGLAPGGRPPVLEVLGTQGVHALDILLGEVERIDVGIGPVGTQKAEGTLWLVTHRHTIAGSTVAMSLEFEVEPHHKLFGLLTIDDLGTLEHAAPLQVVALLIHYGKRHTAVGPVGEVLRLVTSHPYQSRAGGVGLVLTIPIIGAFVGHHSATMGIDVDAAVVGPQLSGLDGTLGSHGKGQPKQSHHPKNCFFHVIRS